MASNEATRTFDSIDAVRAVFYPRLEAARLVSDDPFQFGVAVAEKSLGSARSVTSTSETERSDPPG